MTEHELLNWLRDPAAGADSAQRSAWASRNRELVELIAEIAAEKKKRDPAPSFPPLHKITNVQCSIFDNWTSNNGKKPKRGARGARGVRYVAKVQVWTRSTEITPHNAVFTGSVNLLDGKELTAKVAELRRSTRTKRPFAMIDEGDASGRQWASYGDHLDALASDLETQPLTRLGPMFTKLPGIGTQFHLSTFAAIQSTEEIDKRDRHAQLVIATPTGNLACTGFVTSYPDGKALVGECVMQTRMSDYVSKWSTHKIDFKSEYAIL